MRKRVGRRVGEEGEMTKDEALQLWEEARPAQVDRRGRESSVLSVRLPSHVLDELVRQARGQGKGLATLARELIEQRLASPAVHFGPGAPSLARGEFSCLQRDALARELAPAPGCDRDTTTEGGRPGPLGGASLASLHQITERVGRYGASVRLRPGG